jgi:hypothetical protein
VQRNMDCFNTTNPPQRRVGRDVRLITLVVLSLSILALSGCALETPTRTSYTRTPQPTATLAATPTPVPIVQPSATALVVRPTATSEPGGRIVLLTPGAGDSGWWSNGDSKGIHLGDSFLYSGYFDDEVFVSAARLDLRQVPRGAPIRNATFDLTGLREDRLDPSAENAKWSIQFIDTKEIPDFATSDFQALYNAPAAVTLFPSLTAKDLGARRLNSFTLDATARDWLNRQVLDGPKAIIVRIVSSNDAPSSLFAWDSGSGQMTGGTGPRLVLNMGAPPATPPPLPTRPTLVVTATPTPANVLTVAANALTSTAVARSGGGASVPSEFAIVTATPDQRLVITYTPVPQNGATATAQAAYATAIAVTTGTFTPMPKDAVTPIVVLPTPMPENVLTAAAQKLSMAADIARRGTATPFPYNVVVATVTPTPFVLVNTPRPLNVATARALVAYATAAAMTTGTPTPLPAVVATPTAPPATPLLVYLDELLIPTATPRPTPSTAMARELIGKVLFLSDRDGLDSPRLFALDPATGRLAYLTDIWPYLLAKDRQVNSADGKYNLFVQERIDNVSPNASNPQVPGVFLRDNEFHTTRLLTSVHGWSYDPAFSPQGNRVAFVSSESGNDEIYTVDSDGKNIRRLTSNTWEWDKHPTWSPDGMRILFWSNRDSGRRQLWIMNADGTNQRPFLPSSYNDWDPVWVK